MDGRESPMSGTVKLPGNEEDISLKPLVLDDEGERVGAEVYGEEGPEGEAM